MQLAMPGSAGDAALTPSEKDMTRQTLRTYLWRWLPILLWATVIFLASANPNPYKSLASWWLQPCFSAGAGSPSCAELLGRVLHTSEYAVLAVLLGRALVWRGELRLASLAFALGISELYALSDEVHQLFVPGRTFQWMDLGLDLLGGVLGLTVFALIRKKSAQRIVNDPDR